MNPKLEVSVNKNETKEGIKVQFVLPRQLNDTDTAKTTQELQDKLNKGLSQYKLTVNQDTDVPFSNVIGFLIPIAEIELLIRRAMGGGESEAPAPPAEEPMAEIKRMQKLANVI